MRRAPGAPAVRAPAAGTNECSAPVKGLTACRSDIAIAIGRVCSRKFAKRASLVAAGRPLAWLDAKFVEFWLVAD